MRCHTELSRSVCARIRTIKPLEERLAKIISYFLHPLLMPTYGFLLILYSQNYISTFTPPNFKLAIIAVTLVFTFLLPTVNALVLLRTKRINSLEMETSSERTIPYLSTSVYFFALFFMFYFRNFPAVFYLLILGAGISILFSFFINFFWKISAHAIGVGGIVGATLGISYRLMIDLRMILLFTIIAAGIVCYARLRLKAHEPTQVYAGFFLGMVTELVLMIFVK